MLNVINNKVIIESQEISSSNDNEFSSNTKVITGSIICIGKKSLSDENTPQNKDTVYVLEDKCVSFFYKGNICYSLDESDILAFIKYENRN